MFDFLFRSSEIDTTIETRGKALLAKCGTKAIYAAIFSNDVHVLDWLIEKAKIRFYTKDSTGKTLMHHAACLDAVTVMKRLAVQGAQIRVEAQDCDGNTPMHLAAYHNARDAMKWLKAQGALTCRKNSNEMTPLHMAAAGNALNALEWLREQGNDIFAPDSQGLRPIHHAAMNNAVSTLDLLHTWAGNTVVQYVGGEVNWTNSSRFKLILIDHPEQSLMHMAAKGNAVDVMYWLKDQGIGSKSVNSRDLDRNTPLHIAAMNNVLHQEGRNTDAIEWLNRHGAEINARNSKGETPLDCARAFNFADAVKWLEQNGAESGMQDPAARGPEFFT